MGSKFTPILITVVLNIVQLVLTTFFPIYNKTLFRISPYPLFLTLLQMLLSIPEGLFVAWMNLRFPLSWSWIKIPKEVFWHIAFSSLSYGIMMCSSNLGLFVSDVDFTVIFKISGVVWQGVFAVFLLQEKCTLGAFISLFVDTIGFVLLTAKFQWSTKKMPSVFQCLIQFVSIIFQTIAGIYFKKGMNIIRDKYNISLLTILAWKYLIACIPILISSLAMEFYAWKNFMDVLTKKVCLLLLLGSVTSEIFQLVGLALTKRMSYISNSVFSQLRFIPTLIVSHYLYSETKWSVKQILGTVFLCIGTFIYILFNIFEKRKENEEDSDLREFRHIINEIEPIVEEEEEEEEKELNIQEL